MFFLIILCSFLLFLKLGFVSLGEEILIIIASVFWADMSGSSFKKGLDQEIVLKNEKLKIKINWFYLIQVYLFDLASYIHTYRYYFLKKLVIFVLNTLFYVTGFVLTLKVFNSLGMSFLSLKKFVYVKIMNLYVSTKGMVINLNFFCISKLNETTNTYSFFY